MLRILASLLSVVGLALSGPAAAQSLGLVAMPVVFVSTPVVQPIEAAPFYDPREGQKVLAEAVALPAPLPPRRGADFVGIRLQADLSVSDAPRWQAPHAIDRSRRDYRRGIARFGPFLVLDQRRVALLGETDRATPAAFAAMLRDFPGLAQIDMVECPGTQDDIANMKLGRMIRAARLVTHVPTNGSVRSGAVELFLAGVERDISDGAEFAVHSWRDDYGREASDFAADAPENRKYLAYYHEMGMSERRARAFYDFTNSVPHRSARWLGARDMRRLTASGLRHANETREPKPVAPARETAEPAPKLAYAAMTFS